MLLITIFVELRVVAERSRTRAGSPQAVSRRPCCAVALRRTAWSEYGMARVNKTRPHCLNKMGKTHSKPLAARHGRGTAWARHGMCESPLSVYGQMLWHCSDSEPAEDGCTPDSTYLHELSLGPSARSRKATVSFDMSVRPHGTTRPPLDGIS
jgi:hypothetical protein